MKLTQIALTALVSAAIAFGVASHVASTSGQSEQKKETAFERVIRTNTLRCGYIISPPYLSLDPTTGQKSGLAYDYVTAIGQEIGIKIEWAEEATWGTFAEGLKTGRYDAMCVPLWESGGRAKAALFTKPLYDCDLSLIARADDHRIDGGLSKANNPNLILATVEGDISRTVRARLMPQTKELALPPGMTDGEYFMNIITRKADLGFAFEDVMKKFNDGSSQKLKIVDKEPLQSFGTALTVATGESDLKFLLDSAISTLIKSGEAQSLLSKYSGVSLPTAAKQERKSQ